VTENSVGIRDIRSVLRKHLGQRTVLGVAIPMLVDHIDALKRGIAPNGLAEKQLEAGFRKTLAKFISSDYHSTYIDRRLGARGFLEFSNGRYRIRRDLLAGMGVEDFELLRDELIESLRSAYEQRQAAIKQLERICSLPKECVRER
jgi:hypothetical protein